MIGFKYQGQVNYITRMQDFSDFMEPQVYEAVMEVFENGCGSDGLIQKYEELKEEYDELQSDYSILEDQLDDSDYLHEEIDDLQEELDACEEKYDSLKHRIEDLINQLYFQNITVEYLVTELERII